MPVPKTSSTPTESSLSALSALPEAAKSELLTALIADLEATLRVSGKDAMISVKLGYKTGFQMSYKAGKTSSWLNVNRATMLDCIKAWLEGDFDNA